MCGGGRTIRVEHLVLGLDRAALAKGDLGLSGQRRDGVAGVRRDGIVLGHRRTHRCMEGVHARLGVEMGQRLAMHRVVHRRQLLMLLLLWGVGFPVLGARRVVDRRVARRPRGGEWVHRGGQTPELRVDPGGRVSGLGGDGGRWEGGGGRGRRIRGGSQWEELVCLGLVVWRLLEGLGQFQVGFLEAPVHLGHESDPDFYDGIRLLGFHLRHDLQHGRNGGDAGIEGLVMRELLTREKKK